MAGPVLFDVVHITIFSSETPHYIEVFLIFLASLLALLSGVLQQRTSFTVMRETVIEVFLPRAFINCITLFLVERRYHLKEDQKEVGGLVDFSIRSHRPV